MTTGEAAYLGLIIAAFLALIGILAWVSWGSANSPEADQTQDGSSIGGASSGVHD